MAVTGCVPQAVWLPDSSGFVYTDGDGQPSAGSPQAQQILLYDIAKGESRVIAKNIEGFTVTPAVSPDGKRVAFALFLRGKVEIRKEPEVDKLRVTICDLTGKEVQVSKEFVWDRAKLPGVPDRWSWDLIGKEPAVLYWSPKGDKVLVSAHRLTGLYDVKADKMAMVFGESQPFVFGNTPIRPDGKGFLLEDQGKVTFVDWDGKDQAVKFTNIKVDELTPEEQNEWVMALIPQIHVSSWNKDIAEVKWGRKAFRIDTAKLEATEEKIEGEKAKDAHFIQQKFQFSGKGPKVCVVETKARDFGAFKEGIEKESKLQGTGEFRVELWADGEKQPKILVEKVAGYVQLLAAPNGDYLLIDCFDIRTKPRTDRTPEHSEFRRPLLLLNRKGEVVKTIEQTRP